MSKPWVLEGPGSPPCKGHSGTTHPESLLVPVQKPSVSHAGTRAGARDHAGGSSYSGAGGGGGRAQLRAGIGARLAAGVGSWQGCCGRVGCWRDQQWLWHCEVSPGSLRQGGSIPRQRACGRQALPCGTGQGPGSLGEMEDVRVSWDQEQGCPPGRGGVPRCSGEGWGRGGGRRGRTPRTDPGGPGRKGRLCPALPAPPWAAGGAGSVRSRAEPGSSACRDVSPGAPAPRPQGASAAQPGATRGTSPLLAPAAAPGALAAGRGMEPRGVGKLCGECGWSRAGAQP